MTEAGLAACKSSVGVAMWLFGLCASNQALREAFVDVSAPGVILQQDVSIPMKEKYRFKLGFRFADQASFNASSIAGTQSGANHPACRDAALYAALAPEEKAELGAELDMEVVVTKRDGTLVASYRFQSRCASSWGERYKSRTFGVIEIEKGKYRINVINHAPATPLPGMTTQLVLSGAGAGFP